MGYFQRMSGVDDLPGSHSGALCYGDGSFVPEEKSWETHTPEKYRRL